MAFDYIACLMNPFVLMFASVITGILLGKISIGKFNFGISGALFTGLAIGWGVFGYAKGLIAGESKSAQAAASKLIASGVIDKQFFSLFLILFVVSVGLLAGKDIAIVIKKYGVKFIALGFIITFCGAAVTYGMTRLSQKSDPYEVSGVYTGALTSSPGLAAAIETAREHAGKYAKRFGSMSADEKRAFLRRIDVDHPAPETLTELSEAQRGRFIKNAEAGIGVGHAIGYPFGVLIVIVAVNFFPRLFKMNVYDEKQLFKKEMDEARAMGSRRSAPEVRFDLLAFVIACFIGYLIGKVKVSLAFVGLGTFSLGSTGGSLIGALILGHIGKIGFLNFRMDNKVLGVIRQFALAFFLAIVGLRYGFKVIDALSGSGLFLAFTSFVIGAVAMMVGFVVGRYLFKINWIMLSGAICGGMTSTPGLGAAVDAVGADDPAAGYGATYPFALLGMVIFTIILHNLPM